jgi:tetraacyldisaccharide-1-P 4'-kinase
VISVGNLSVGGNGKTPIVAHLALWLVAEDESPTILSRGYGRRRVEPGVTVVSDGAAILGNLDSSGDEPLMLARMVLARVCWSAGTDTCRGDWVKRSWRPAFTFSTMGFSISSWRET